MNDIQKIQKAIKFAIKTHEVYQKQTRKGKDISYITHPLTVGIILSRFNASDDLVCAGILHDTIEDSIPEKKVTFEMLEERFGKDVAQMVLDVTETNKSLPWEERKKEAIEHIKKFSHDSLMLKSADVISNVSEIIDDYNKEGDSIFERFGCPKPKKENTIQNYLKVIKTILDCWPENPMKDELNNLKEKLETTRKENKIKKESENYGLSEKRLKDLEKARIEFEKETRELNELQKKNPQEMNDYYDEVFGK
jgi:(p)ppGpp synthase/HD superfamily hydrolase